jgi:hypothetical protein
MIGNVPTALRLSPYIGPLAATIILGALLGTPRAHAQEGYAAAVAAAVPRVEEITGLRFKTPPRVVVLDRRRIRELLERLLDEESESKALAAEQMLYRRLGIIPDTLDWRALQLKLLAEQVVAFYDPHTKALYLDADAEGEALGIVIPHELVHALQDQYVNLDSLEHLEGEDDRVLAAESAMEGQATLVAFEAALGFGPDLSGGEEAIRESVREERSSQPVLSTAPLFLQEVQIFPYLSGMQFLARFHRERPGQSPYGADLPTSTTQIMHPDAYFATPRRRPLTVTLSAPNGIPFETTNVMGEFAIRSFLWQLLRDEKRAARASQGWAGDRYAIVRAPSGDGLAWVTCWDSADDAKEFADAMRRVVTRRYRKPPSHGEGMRTVYDPPGRQVSIDIIEVSGHPAVVYWDFPTGISGDAIDAAAFRAE